MRSNQPALQWVLASGNKGKLKEFTELFAPWKIQVIPQGELGVTEAQEPHITFVENALEKARHASKHTGLPALADDSGLCVQALGGEPGVLSARYAEKAGREKSDASNNAYLLERMQGVSDRRAYFVCALAFVRHAADPCPLIAQAIWHGELLEQAAGEGGFGYDPLFWVPEVQLTAGQLAHDAKNLISHRGKALALLKHQLVEHGVVE